MEKGLISVDRWAEYSQAYFLTHLHSDHIRSLSSTWAKAPIFCSPITAKLFPVKFPDFNLSLIRVLDVGTWHSLSLVSPFTGSKITVQVMPIDAHHCPGAVMFLFRGDFGCVLHTGDFRWEKNSERAKLGREMLLNALEDDAVDFLYLDTTYFNPRYQFPPREVAAHQVLDIITSHPDDDIVIGINNLGKEDLLLHISNALNIKIWVWPERLQTMHLLGFHDIFTTNTSLTRVRAIPRYSFSIDTLEGLNSFRSTIGILPSGAPWMDEPFDQINDNIRPVKKLHRYMYSVKYSDHSNYAELQDFIKLVKPTNMEGIVSSSSCHIDPLGYFGRNCGINQQPSQNLHHHQKFGRGYYTGIEKKRKRVRRLGFNLNRVSVAKRRASVAKRRASVTMRRAGRGVKLDEYECSE